MSDQQGPEQDWPGYCDRGVCAAGRGHAGSCAEASGWADEPEVTVEQPDPNAALRWAVAEIKLKAQR